MRPAQQDEWGGKFSGLTYLIKGRIVIDQKIALRPPMTSSGEGTGPEAGQIPFKTYLKIEDLL